MVSEKNTGSSQRLPVELVRSALAGAGARVATLLVGLFMTPYLVARLGIERFGVWALITAAVGMIGLCDLGLRNGLVRYLAAGLEAPDRQSETSEILSTSLLFYGLVSAVVGPVLFAARGPILSFLGVPPGLRAEASAAFVVAVASLLATNALAIFPAVCDARRRMDLMNGLGVATLLLTSVTTVVLIERGGGLPEVAAAQLLGVIVYHVLVARAALRMAGPLGISPKRFSTRWFRRLFGFGARLQISTLCGVANRQFDKLLLSRWAGLTLVGSYEIAARVVANLGSTQTLLTAVLLPASSHLLATGDRDRLVRLYRRAQRYCALLAIPPFLFVVSYAPVAMVAWIGRPEPQAVVFTQLLATGYLMNSSTNAVAFVCQGIGRADLQAQQSFVQLVVNVVLSVVLFSWLGPYGAALGTSIALIVGALLFVRWFHPVLGISTVEVVREAAGGPLVASAMGVLAAWLVVGSGAEALTRYEALQVLVAASAIFSSVYLLACWWGRVVEVEDVQQLWRLLRGRPSGAGR
jgi:O-antigen/teichoic acid export membrane protein